MSNYSPVGPARLLVELHDDHLIEGYQLLLAHDVVAQPYYHKQFIRSFNAWRGESGIIILDNSLIELGGAADINMMREASDIVDPDFIVMPDVLLDLSASVAAFGNAYESWSSLAANRGAGLLAVVQGQNEEEMMSCLRGYATLDTKQLVKAIGIPRAYTNAGHSRKVLANKIHARTDLPIHLMGFSDNFVDDMHAAVQPGVMGIDSATPLRAGFENARYTSSGCPPIVVKRENFFLLAQQVTQAMSYNVAYIRGILDARKVFV